MPLACEFASDQRDQEERRFTNTHEHEHVRGVGAVSSVECVDPLMPLDERFSVILRRVVQKS